jgi:hypothetical protein
VVPQRPIKTLYVGVSFILAVPLVSLFSTKSHVSQSHR